MDILKMLADLRDQREAIEQTIIVLERIVLGQRKRRGRALASMASAPNGAAGRRAARIR